MPLLASVKMRTQLNADKRAQDAEKAFARDQGERRANHKLGGSKGLFAQAFFEVSEKARNKSLAHAKSKPSKGRDAQGLLVSLEAPKVVKDKLKKVEVVKPSPWLSKLDDKLVHTPVKKLVKVVHVDSPKITKVELSKSTQAQEIAKSKEKKSFEKKFEKASESERDFSAFPDLDWAGFPSQSSQSRSI